MDTLYESRRIIVESDNRDLKFGTCSAKTKWVDVEQFQLQLAAPIESILSSLPSFPNSVSPPLSSRTRRGTKLPSDCFLHRRRKHAALVLSSRQISECTGGSGDDGARGDRGSGDGKFSTVLFVYNLCFPESGQPETPFHRFGYVNSRSTVFAARFVMHLAV